MQVRAFVRCLAKVMCSPLDSMLCPPRLVRCLAEEMLLPPQAVARFPWLPSEERLSQPMVPCHPRTGEEVRVLQGVLSPMNGWGHPPPLHTRRCWAWRSMGYPCPPRCRGREGTHLDS